MPRGNTGVYTLPNGTLVSDGDIISPNQHNPAFNDVAAALTDSLSRSGQGQMQAALNMGGNRVRNVAPGVDPTDAATMAQITSAGGVPPGVVADFAGSTAPEGWLLCGGQSVSRTTYAALFAVIGTTYGSVDGNSFNLPDARGRVTAGRDFAVNGSNAERLTATTISPSAGVVGGVGGSETQVLTESQMPSHTHAVTGSTNSAGNHSHTVAAINPDVAGALQPGFGGPSTSTETTSTAGAHTHTISVTAENTGGGQAHPNVQPTLILGKIIKV